MSISYSALTNYARAGLPTVEGGFGSMNIMKDPPRSIMTRRIDKVGQTSSITSMVDDSSDRACEAINMYARGVNPMVSVDYGNAGNNGGRNGSAVASSASSMASLPYKVIKDGAFRPPIIPLELRLPLSRQARDTTSAFTRPGFADFSRKLMCPGKKLRAVKDIIMHTEARPTASYRIDAAPTKPFEIKYVIKNPVEYDARAGVTGVRFQDLTEKNVQVPTHGMAARVKVAGHTNKNDTSRTVYADMSNVDTEQFTKDLRHTSVTSTASTMLHRTPIEDLFGGEISLKANLRVSADTVKTGHLVTAEHRDANMELDRMAVSARAETNKGRNIYHRPTIEHKATLSNNRPVASARTSNIVHGRQTTQDISGRTAFLRPKITAGSYGSRGSLPTGERVSMGSSSSILGPGDRRPTAGSYHM